MESPIKSSAEEFSWETLAALGVSVARLEIFLPAPCDNIGEVEEDSDWNPPFRRLFTARPTFGVSTIAGEGPLHKTRPLLPPLIAVFPRSANAIGK